MCGRNTENSIVELGHEIANYQWKRYVVMKFIHDKGHIAFNDIGKGRRKREVYEFNNFRHFRYYLLHSNSYSDRIVLGTDRTVLEGMIL